MKSENKYIGDEKFQNMLDHYLCPTPINVIRMKFVGAICSPNLSLRPTDIISSFWEDGKTPRLETKEEADLFFKFFMGLWDDVFDKVKQNNIKLSTVKTNNSENLADACYTRVMEIEFGYNEGFWGGLDDLKIPAFIAQMVDSLSELAGVYGSLNKKLERLHDFEEIKDTFVYTDKMAEKAISFIIENFVLPRIEDLGRTMN